MSSKLEAILATAWHPETPENEAIAAFLAARRLNYTGTKNKISHGESELNMEIGPIHVNFFKQFINDINKLAWEENIRLKLIFGDREDGSSIYATLEIVAQGSEKSLEKLKGLVEYLFGWMNSHSTPNQKFTKPSFWETLFG